MPDKIYSHFVSEALTSLSLEALQNAFTNSVRDPENCPLPAAVPEERMAVYQGAAYLNAESIVSNFFPMLKKVYDPDSWRLLIEDYVKYHRSSQMPVLTMLSGEFLLYLENERDLTNDPGFLLELTHYQWTRFALSIDPQEIELAGVNLGGDLMAGVPVMSQLAIPLCYQYPVHKINPDFIPDMPPQELTYIVIYRNFNDDVKFLKLNPPSARLIEKIQQDEDKTGETLLTEIAKELANIDQAKVIAGGMKILQELRTKSIILGTRCA